MTFPIFPAILRRLCLALLLGSATHLASAVPLAEMRLEDLLPMAPDFRNELKLNANQQILWQQMEGRTRQLLRERKARRERLQASVQQALAKSGVELRELVGALDQENDASLAEQKQLRAWWLDVNDALDETQRRAVASFIAGQMARVMGGDGPAPHAEGHSREGGEPGGRKGGRGGAGMGAGMGNGGANISFPGN